MPVAIQRGLEIVPGYTLVRRLGSGMAGEVWVARASGGVYVAIKVIRDMNMIGSKRELGALRIVREVKHTNLCPLIGVWFFDSQGELLSNAATDEILGRESSLIDTECLMGASDRDRDLRETHTMAIGAESSADTDDSQLKQTSDLQTEHSRFSDSAANASSESTTKRTAGDRRNDDDPDTSMGDARQMIVAMGLGEKTLQDRLVEMRAPGNAPAENDPLHLPDAIPVPELLKYIAGAASAIDELNLKHNIYHCDIKPQNILIVGGNSQVCDFGLARRVHESRRTQLAIGTPAYGAPEMLFDQTYTKTIDQYSLAITYYELRTGKLPFETSRRSSFLRAKANGELKFDDVPPAEKAVMERATQLDPDLRYGSCTEFVEALTKAIYAPPVTVSTQHHRGVLAAAAVAVLTFVGGGSFYFLNKQPNLASVKPLEIRHDLEVQPVDEEKPVTEPEKELEEPPILVPPPSELPEKMPVKLTPPEPDESEITPPPIKPEPTPQPKPVPKPAPKTLAEHLAVVKSDFHAWSDQASGKLPLVELEKLVDRLEKLTPQLNPVGQWTVPVATTAGEDLAPARFVPALVSLADELREFTTGDSRITATNSEQPQLLNRLALVPALALSWSVNESSNALDALLLKQLPDRMTAVRTALETPTPFTTAEQTADAAFTLTTPKIASDALSEIYQADLRRAAKVNSDAVRLTKIAEAQANALITLRRQADQAAPSEIAAIHKKSLTWVRDLDEQASDDKRTSGWQRLSDTLNVNARVVAGLTQWDAKLVSDALKQWIEIQNDPGLTTTVPALWRHAAATNCLQLNIDLALVTDEDTSRIRYADSVRRSAGVMTLIEKLAVDSPEIMKRAEPERFLLAVAQEDWQSATKVWDAMNLTIGHKTLTPQLGFALWTNASRRLAKTTDANERESLIGKLVLGLASQFPNEQLDETLQTRMLETLRSVAKLVDRPHDSLPIVPKSLQHPELAILCERFVDETVKAKEPRDHAAFIERLDQMEFAAAIAAGITTNQQRRQQLYLIAGEGFIQTRYEELDDQPAVKLIGRLSEYARAAKPNGTQEMSLEGTFLIGRSEDQNGFLAREDAEIMRRYALAREAYTNVIDAPTAPADLRGSAYRCRAALLPRIAALEKPERQGELLDLASADAAAAMGLPTRWHFDSDDRFTTAAEVNLSMVRLLPQLDVAKKQALIDDADRFLGEAIGARLKLAYPIQTLEAFRLNAYLLDLLVTPKGQRWTACQQKVVAMMNAIDTVPVAEATKHGLTGTINTNSNRARVHWHSICAMIEHVQENSPAALSHIRYAMQIATETLPESDDRRHRAILIYVQFRGSELMQGIAKNGRADQKLVAELKSILDTIVDPTPHYRNEKQGFVRDLSKM
jgi:serine/threonine protein kinase